MKHFDMGDEVRITIPDQSVLDFERLHGREGTVV